MCNPAAASLAFMAINTLAQADAQKQRAHIQDLVANAGLAQNEAALDAESGQVEKRARDDMSAVARNAMIERGRLAAIGAESGLTGNSAYRVEAESHFNEGVTIARIDSN